MTRERRARSEERARRSNAAVTLLDTGMDATGAARRLAQRYAISERQAWRYVERARAEGSVEIPARKVVFTVKLAVGLVRRIRASARRSGDTISALVTRALSEFLDRYDRGARGGG